MRLVLLLVVLVAPVCEGEGSIRACIAGTCASYIFTNHLLPNTNTVLYMDIDIAAIRLGRPGNGSTSTSCFYCDPARPRCSKGCQGRIDDLYFDCDGVSLPDGYYYDENAGNVFLFSFHNPLFFITFYLLR